MPTSEPLPWRRDAALTFCTLIALLAWDALGADLPVMQTIGSPGGFALRDQWLVSVVLHEGGRWLSIAALLLVAVNAAWPLPIGAVRMSRRLALWCLLATGASLLLIPALKRLSLTSCPWDLAQFGGHARYVSHWALGIADGGSGRCFPAGHASGAFSFLAVGFALRTVAPHAARRWMLGVLGIGVAFGIAQSLRGAHYPSHTLWTAWICWTTGALLWHGSQRWLQPGAGRAARPAILRAPFA